MLKVTDSHEIPEYLLNNLGFSPSHLIIYSNRVVGCADVIVEQVLNISFISDEYQFLESRIKNLDYLTGDLNQEIVLKRLSTLKNGLKFL